MIDLSPNHLETVECILDEHVPECEVRAFGSRVTWTAKDYSDLDLAVIGPRALDLDTLRLLKEAFEESDLPFRVDVIDWQSISESFRRLIAKNYEVVQKGRKKSRDMEGGRFERTVLKSWLYRPDFPTSWRRTSVHSLATWINGMAFRNIQFTPTGRPVIKIAEIKNGIAGQTKFTDAEYDACYLVSAGDMLFSWSGQPETSIDVSWWRGRDGWLNQHIFKVIPDEEQCLPGFLYYLMKYLKPNFVAIARNKQTTGLGHVTKTDLENIEVGVPPQPFQKTIAYILGSLDDKIEVNRRMNETLESIARAAFKSWFVDFDPVRAKADGHQPVGMDAETSALFPDSFEDSPIGRIPSGWRCEQLSNSIELIGGGTPRTSISTFWGGGIPWFSVADIPRTGDVFVIQTEKTITEEGLNHSSARLLPKGTTIITARGTVGKCALVGVPMAMNQSCYGIRPKGSSGDYHTHFLIRHTVGELQQKTHGSVFETITRETFRSIQVLNPPTEFIVAFEKAVLPFLESILQNLRESKILVEIRDALLPKLISGEIRVKDAEKYLEEHAG